MYDLWSYIVRGPTKCLRSCILHVLLAHTEVGNLDVAVLIKHDVVQLQVSVDDTQGMEEDNTNCYLRCVKPAGYKTKLVYPKRQNLPATEAGLLLHLYFDIVDNSLSIAVI